MSRSIRDGNLWIRICHTQADAERAIADARMALLEREAEEPGVYRARTRVRATMAIYGETRRCMAVSVRIMRKDETPEQFAARFPWKGAG